MCCPTNAYSIAMLKKKSAKGFDINKVEVRQPRTRMEIINELTTLLDNKLYVYGWQAVDLFSYSLQKPKDMIRKRSCKPSDYQIFRLFVAYYKDKPIGWLVETKWVQSLWRDKEVWQYTKPYFRNKGVAKLLSQMAGYDKRMYESKEEFENDEIQIKADKC
jgi:hypothetical protein